MKTAITILIVIIILYFFFNGSSSNGASGKLEDVEDYLKRLFDSTDDKYLIISLNDDKFIQFSGSSKGIELDFPVVSESQKILEAKFRETAKTNKLTIIENNGSDGTRFLDINLDTISESVEITKIFLKELFEVNEHTSLNFEINK